LADAVNETKIGKELSPFLSGLLSASISYSIVHNSPINFLKNCSYNFEEDSSEIKKTDLIFDKEKPQPHPSKNNIVAVETKNFGDVSISVYIFYFNAAGGIIVGLFIGVASIFVSLAWFSQSYSLWIWMEDMETNKLSHIQISFQFYLLCVGFGLFINVFRITFLIYSSLVAAHRLHYRVMKKTILATCSWFDSTPVGRIINRFSQDMSTIDSKTLYRLVDFFDCLLGSIQIVSVIA
jgi:uncharacterized membrane protein